MSVIATMQVSRSGRDVDIACCRSVVKVAIPQRRGSELPMKATRRSGVMPVPPQSHLISKSRNDGGADKLRSFALQIPAAGRITGSGPG